MQRQQAKLVRSLFKLQKRNLQSPYKPGQSIGFIDIMQGTYEDPKYGLELKPLEWRDEQYVPWLSVGSALVLGPMLMVAALCGFSLMWQNFFDTSVSFFRGDPHPFFDVKNGEDYYNRSPLYKYAGIYSPDYFNIRNLFHLEVAQVLEKKQ